MLRLAAMCLSAVLSLSSTFAFQNTIDSLKRYEPNAKPGWDQIDLAMALGRAYINAGEYDSGKAQIARVRELWQEHNIPEAEAYALIMENTIAYLHEYDADKAIRLCEEAIAVAKQYNNKDAEVYAGFQLGENYMWEKGDVKKGEEILLGLLPELTGNVNQKNKANVFKDLGTVYSRLGDFEKAFDYNSQALATFREMAANPEVDPRLGRPSYQLIDPEFHLGNLLDNMGDLYFNMGNSSKALESKIEALTIFEQRGVKADIAWINSNLGILYSSLGRYQESLQHLQTGRLMFEELGLQNDVARANNTMISLFINLEDYETAEKYVEENLIYYKQINRSVWHFNTGLQNLNIQLKKENLAGAKHIIDDSLLALDSIEDKNSKAWFYRLQGTYEGKVGDMEAAEGYFRKSLGLYTQVNQLFNIANCEYNLAEIFFYRENYDSALYYVESGLQKVKNTKDITLAKNSFYLLSKIYDGMGEYKQAYENHQAYYNYTDSIYTADAQAKLKEEQVRQEVVGFQKEKELAQQNAQLLADRNQLYIIIGVVLVVILVMMGYLYTNLRSVKAKTEAQNVQLTQLNQTKDKFFGIIAHDLRSPLLGLQSVGDQIHYHLEKQQPEKLEKLSGEIEGTTKKLTDLLDNLLNWALLQNGMIPYHPEEVDLRNATAEVVDLLTPVASLKGVSLINNIGDNNLAYADNKAVQTILRNIIANAIKYTDAGGEVVVDVSTESEKSVIKINDNGTGIAADRLPKLFDLSTKSEVGTKGEKGSGLGLILCKELVELNKGSISVNSDLGKGSSFTFDLPRHVEAA